MRDDQSIVILKCLNRFNEVYHKSNILCSFGISGLVFYISDNCNENNSSFSCLGLVYEYELPKGIEYDTPQAKEYLAGSFNFKV